MRLIVESWSVRAVALVALLFVAGSAGAAPSQFVVVVDPVELTATLIDHGLSLDETKWTSPRASVVIASPIAPLTTQQSFDMVEALNAEPHVRGAGSLLDSSPGEVKLYSGLALVRVAPGTSDADAITWVAANSLTMIGPAVGKELYLVLAPLDHGPLLAMAGSPASGLGSPAIEFIPITHHLVPLGTRPDRSPARYHAIPTARNILAAELIPLADREDFDDAVSGGVSLGGAMSTVEVYQFADEVQMMQVLRRIRLLDEVSRAGPLVQQSPLAFMTSQIIVKFKNDSTRFRSVVAMALLGINIRTPIRKLPYGEEIYLLTADEPSYALYDAAAELVNSELAHFAVPNLFRENISSCGEFSNCGWPHQQYLRLIDVCETWDLPAVFGKSIVIGFLDQGANPNNTYGGYGMCEALRVTTAIDFGSMNECRPSVDEGQTWCGSACASVVESVTSGHGNQMSAIAAARRHVSGDLQGVAPGTTILSAQRRMNYANDGMTDVRFADALWWMAGGDPEWCYDGEIYECPSDPDPDPEYAYCISGECPDAVDPAESDPLPPPLSVRRRADIINLSFSRDDLQIVDCTRSPPPSHTCVIVCDDDETSCGIDEEVLGRLYNPEADDDPRALIVNAVGTGVDDDGLNNSLWNLHSTVSVGSVQVNGSPLNNSTKINYWGADMDLVAPTADDGQNRLCQTCSLVTGSSSAAAAAVSGVAAMMLRQNPHLTPKQASCILRETADPGALWDTTSPAPADVPACKFSEGLIVPGETATWKHSDCFGRGLVDACAAVRMARACKDGKGCCMCDELGRVSVCKPAWPVLPIQGELVMNYRPADVDHIRFPDLFIEWLRCLVNGRCRCIDKPDLCTRFNLINGSERKWRDVRAKICAGDHCWDLKGRKKRWRRGKVMSLSIQPTREMLDWQRALNLPLTLRLYSRGKPIAPPGRVPETRQHETPKTQEPQSARQDSER